jgi:hypothetical protein
LLLRSLAGGLFSDQHTTDHGLDFHHEPRVIRLFEGVKLSQLSQAASAMLDDGLLGDKVDFVVALFIGLRRATFGNVHGFRVAFGPLDRNRQTPTPLHSFIEILPQVAIPHKGKWAPRGNGES